MASRSITALHLACSSLSTNVLRSLLDEIEQNSSLLASKTVDGESLIGFMLNLHKNWNPKMRDIIIALLEKGYKPEWADMEML